MTIIYNFLNVCPFDYSFAVMGSRKPATSVGCLSLPPTNRLKSVRNRCVIEVFGVVCVLSRCF